MLVDVLQPDAVWSKYLREETKPASKECSQELSYACI
jgi:hypothetical protein